MTTVYYTVSDMTVLSVGYISISSVSDNFWLEKKKKNDRFSVTRPGDGRRDPFTTRRPDRVVTDASFWNTASFADPPASFDRTRSRRGVDRLRPSDVIRLRRPERVSYTRLLHGRIDEIRVYPACQYGRVGRAGGPNEEHRPGLPASTTGDTKKITPCPRRDVAVNRNRKNGRMRRHLFGRDNLVSGRRKKTVWYGLEQQRFPIFFHSTPPPPW